MVQAIGTLLLAVRRLKAGGMGHVDIRNASMAFGGLVVQAVSAIIVLTGRRWERIPRPSDVTPIDVFVRMVIIRNAEHLGAIARLIVTTTFLGF
jgi:hypothetical protein